MYSGQFMFHDDFSFLTYFSNLLRYFPFLTYFPVILISPFYTSHLFLHNISWFVKLFPKYLSLISQLFLGNFSLMMLLINLSHLLPDLLRLSSLKTSWSNYGNNNVQSNKYVVRKRG